MHKDKGYYQEEARKLGVPEFHINMFNNEYQIEMLRENIGIIQASLFYEPTQVAAYKAGVKVKMATLFHKHSQIQAFKLGVREESAIEYVNDLQIASLKEKLDNSLKEDTNSYQSIPCINDPCHHAEPPKTSGDYYHNSVEFVMA